MRTIAVAAGLLGFAAIAMGGEGVMIKSPTRAWQAEYVYAPGTSEESVRSISLSRKFTFFYPEAQLNGDRTGMAPDANANIQEYRWDDVVQAMRDARIPANASAQDRARLLKPFLDKLPVHTVDCRQVARDMVEHLVGYRLKVTTDSRGNQTRSYYDNQDQADVIATAEQLSSITISRDTSITPTDIEPRFTCRSVVVDQAPAHCGDLRLRYNPLPAQSGAFAGKPAVVLPAECTSHGLDYFSKCKLPYEVARCGLSYSEKASGARAENPSTWGLADFLKTNRDAEIRSREDGTYNPSAELQAETTAEEVQGQFVAPGSRGSFQPL
jgi:hypothetical protein